MKSVFFLILIGLAQSVIELSECVDGLEFIFIDTNDVSQDIAQRDCEDLQPSATLSLMRSERVFQLSVEQALNLRLRTGFNFDHWIAHERTDRSLSGTNPQSFGINNGDFGDEAGQFPWRNGQPNADSFNFDQGDCVRVSMPEEDWVSRSCSDPNFPFCERPCQIQSNNGCSNLELKEFIHLRESVSFDKAAALCAELDPDAKLLRPLSSDEIDRALNLGVSLDLQQPFWVNLKRKDLSSSDSSPEDFGINAGSFGDVAGIFPWQSNQPASAADGDCVVADFDNGSWRVTDCAERNFVICQKFCNLNEQPTENPSSNPTITPTGNPSSNPTNNPTGNPTETPTFFPTEGSTDTSDSLLGTQEFTGLLLGATGLLFVIIGMLLVQFNSTRKKVAELTSKLEAEEQIRVAMLDEVGIPKQIDISYL